jgi:hypothetical protein
MRFIVLIAALAACSKPADSDSDAAVDSDSAAEAADSDSDAASDSDAE